MTSISTSQLGPRAALAAIVPIGLAVAALLIGGMSFFTVGAILVVVAPLALYAALRWPLETLFGLYVALVPFDNLLNTGSFGTLTKLIGIVAGGFLLLWIVRRNLVSFSAPPLRILALLVIWMFVTALWAPDQKAALGMMATLCGLMLLYAVVSMMPATATQLRLLLTLVAIGGICAAAYGANKFYHDPALSQGALAMRRLVIQVGQYEIDPNHFSDALIFPAAILLMWSLSMRSLLVRAACIAGLGLIVASIMLSSSREGLIALVLIAAYYFWRSRYRLKLTVAFAGVALLAMSVQSSMFLRFANVWETGGSGRTSIWSVALEAAKHRPLQGYGIGNFVPAFNMFYLTTHQPYPYGWDSPAHNLVMHYLVETGLIGLGLIAAFFWAQFRSLREIGPENEFYDYRLVFEATLLAIVAVSMTIDLFQYKYAWLVFAMLALFRNVAMGYQQRAEIRPTSAAMMSERSASSLSRDLPVSPSLRSSLLPIADN